MWRKDSVSVGISIQGQRTKLPWLLTVTGARLLTASLITIAWKWRSQSCGIGDHDGLERVITIVWIAQSARGKP
jgi:hypothetical protein